MYPASVSSSTSCLTASALVTADQDAALANVLHGHGLAQHQQQRITSPTLDSIRTVPSGSAGPNPVPSGQSTVSTIRPFAKNYYTNSSPLYSNEIVINSANQAQMNHQQQQGHGQPTPPQQQTPSRLPALFSVSSLVNMPTSPAPKSLDFIDLKGAISPAMTTNGVPLMAVINGTNNNSNNAIVSLPASHMLDSHQLDPASIHPGQVLKEIFAACKIGDLAKLKKYLSPGNVNIRDTAGGRSTVSS